MTVFAALSVSMSSDSARPAVVSGPDGDRRHAEARSVRPGHRRRPGVRDRDERLAARQAVLVADVVGDLRGAPLDASGGLPRRPGGSGGGAPAADEDEQRSHAGARDDREQRRRTPRSGSGRRDGARGRRASPGERRSTLPTPFGETRLRRPPRPCPSHRRPRALLRQVDLGDRDLGLVEQVQELVAEELAARVEHVGDVLDRLAVVR